MSTADRKELNVPDVPTVVFERNFIKTAVCELRFPTLLEYETEPPRKLQKELRKDYPLYDTVQAVSVGPDTVGRERRYLFKSRDGKWVASFKSFAIALETSHYTEFDEFVERLNRLLAKSRALIDSDFFTPVSYTHLTLPTILRV